MKARKQYFNLLRSCYYVLRTQCDSYRAPSAVITTPEYRLLQKRGSHDRTGLRAAEKGAGRGVTDRRTEG